jgi:hypothetical protein
VAYVKIMLFMNKLNYSTIAKTTPEIECNEFFFTHFFIGAAGSFFIEFIFIEFLISILIFKEIRKRYSYTLYYVISKL